MKLSVVLATRNEEKNIERCIKSVEGIADEIIVVDEYSSDHTRQIAEKLGAKVNLEEHHDIFHITKQKALEKAKSEWILQLDADEVVTPLLSEEIKKIVHMSNVEIIHRQISGGRKWRLFKKHQAIIEARDGQIGKKTGEVVGFFIARRNMFLGRPLIHAGVFPDGVIRLVKNGKARFPQKSVHEQIDLDGEVSWLENYLDHYDSPTFKRYIERANRYTSLTAKEFETRKISKGFLNLIFYTFIKPIWVFLNLYIRHLGFLDGAQGFLWSIFSALHFPIAYFKYLTSKE